MTTSQQSRKCSHGPCNNITTDPSGRCHYHRSVVAAQQEARQGVPPLTSAVEDRTEEFQPRGVVMQYGKNLSDGDMVQIDGVEWLIKDVRPRTPSTGAVIALVHNKAMGITKTVAFSNHAYVPTVPPRQGQVVTYITATKTSNHTEDGEHDEENGWVDMSWSRNEVFPSRNDVRPFADYTEAECRGCGFNMEEAATEEQTCSENKSGLHDFPSIEDWAAAQADKEFGGIENNGDGTYYAADGKQNDLQDDSVMRYAMHLTDFR